MKDRELLELAAKAAGVSEYLGAWFDGGYGTAGFLSGRLGNGRSVWNPLTDDGDALRLAVKLKMAVQCLGNRCYAKVPLVTELADVFDYADPYAATRRAIVRAAAEIGRVM